MDNENNYEEIKKRNEISKKRIITGWIVFSILTMIGLYVIYFRLHWLDDIEIVNKEFQLIIAWGMPLGLCSMLSGIITTAVLMKRKYIGILIWGYIPAIVFMLCTYIIALLFPSTYEKYSEKIKELTTAIEAKNITTKSGSQWTETDKENVYYHVVKHGESLEYIFNDITISLIKAQEQHFDILKKNEANIFEIVPVKNYETELQQHTFLYSGLNPGDTVFMLKHELEKFSLEKGL